MISSGYLAFLNTLNKERYNGTCDEQNIKLINDLQIFVVIFVLLLFIDLIIMFYAIYCLLDSKLEWYVTLLILILMFSPGLGFITSIGIIFYYHSVVLVKRQALGQLPPPKYIEQPFQFF
jgi:hypothetical protein